MSEAKGAEAGRKAPAGGSAEPLADEAPSAGPVDLGATAGTYSLDSAVFRERVRRFFDGVPS